MKVLTVAGASGAGTIGGADVVAEELNRVLNSEGTETVTVCPDNQSSGSEEVRRLPYKGNLNTVSRVIEIRRLVDRHLQDSPCDVVHSHFALHDFAIGTRARRRAPFIRTFHGPWDLEGEIQDREIGAKARVVRSLKKAIRFRIERASLRKAARITTLSRTFKDLVVQRYGISPDKVSIVPGGVDLDRFRPSEDFREDREKLGLGDDRLYILTIRRLVPRMGVDILLDAFAQVLQVHPKAVLLIGGKGPSRGSLEEKAAPLGDSVRFLGFISDQDLPRFYRSVDLFVVPTRAQEGFGLVTLEALASGTPVVATPVGGNVEILSGLDASYLASSVCDKALAATISKKLQRRSNSVSGKLRRWVESNYSWQRFANEMSSIYLQASKSR